MRQPRVCAMSAQPEAGRTQRQQYAFTAHLRDPQGSPAHREWKTVAWAFTAIWFSAMWKCSLSANFPVIRTLYDAAAWNALTRDFLREHRCHTPLFPEFGREFLRYVEARQQRGADDPPFMLELAHYEWAELALTLDEHDIASIAHDPAGDPLNGVPVLSPLAWVLGYRFPVQLIGPGFSSRRRARPSLPCCCSCVAATTKCASTKSTRSAPC